MLVFFNAVKESYSGIGVVLRRKIRFLKLF